MHNKEFSDEQKRLKEPIERLLQSLNMDHYNIIDIPTVMSVNGGERTIYIVEVNSEKESRDSKIIIDMIAGPPSVEQVIDVTHRFGADCKHKIIVTALDNEMLSMRNNFEKDKCYSAYQEIDLNNLHGFMTYLVQTIGLEIADIKKANDFEVIVKPNPFTFNLWAPLPTSTNAIDKDLIRKILSQREGPKSRLSHDYKELSKNVSYICQTKVGNIFIKVNDMWNDEGMFFIINGIDKHHKDSLRTFWKLFEGEIKDLYAGCSVTYNENSDIVIKLNEIPLFYAINAPLQEQEDLFEFISNKKDELLSLSHATGREISDGDI